MRSLASRILIALAVVLAALAAWQALATYVIKPDDKRLVIEGPPQLLGTFTPGEHQLRFRITNPSAQEKRLIGMMCGCRSNICFFPKVDAPIEIPPGVVFDYIVELSVSGEGPFEFPLILYFDDNGLRRHEVVFRGVVDGEPAAPAGD